jgi:hypothetical protein
MFFVVIIIFCFACWLNLLGFRIEVSYFGKIDSECGFRLVNFRGKKTVLEGNFISMTQSFEAKH